MFKIFPMHLFHKTIQTDLIKPPWGWWGVALACMHLNCWCHVFVRALLFRSYTLNNPNSFHDILKCPNVFSWSSHQSADTVAHRCSEIAQKLWQIPPTRTHDFTAGHTPECVLYVLLVLMLFRSGRKGDSVKNVRRQFIKNRIKLSN